MYGWKDGAKRYFADDRTQPTVYDDKRQNLTKLSKQELIQYIKTNMSDNQSTVQYEDKPLVSAEHPTMKPIRLVGRLIINSSKPGWLVLDPFGGSGSTLIACEQSGRICRTIELDEKYCDVIVKRYIEQAGGSGGVFVDRGGIKSSYFEVIA
jgi:DNA modification methylase